jgi:phage repressor protein C with HTH and peptisase S24 domain
MVALMAERHDRLRQARIAAGFARASDAAARFGWNENTYKSNENGNAPFSFRKAKEYAEAFAVRAEWLYDETGPVQAGGEPLVRIIGRVGADAEGVVIQTDGQEGWDMVPLPPGGAADAVALEVVGHSMRAVAEDGSLIYFEDQRNPPAPDMVGYYCIVETEDGRVLFKRLLRGSLPGLYMLESQVGPPIEDVRIRWAAEPTAIIPPKQARRIIRRAGERQVA